MKTNAACFVGFFARSFRYLYEAGLPLAEVRLLEKEASKLSPETFAMALVHAYERALAIQEGMKVLDEGLDKRTFHFLTDSNGVWFMPQSQAKGLECAYATYGRTRREAQMEYVLIRMTLPIRMGAWLREYS